MEKFTKAHPILLLFILTLIAGLLRFANLANNPPGLTVDEVSTGYNSYSILKTGRDEYGTFLPLSFKSLGDYKPPFYIYASTIPIAIFGLNEFSVRFLSAFIGTLSIPLSFFLFQKITKRVNVSMIGAAIFAISPWHIYYSRLAFESPVAMTFVMLGVFSFFKMIEKSAKWAIFSAFFFILSMYTYHSERLFVPLLIICMLLFYRKFFKKNHYLLFTFLVTSFLLVLPLLFSLIFGQIGTRAAMTLITNDPNFVRNIATKTIHLNNLAQFVANFLGNKYLLLLFFITEKFVAYLQPSFLFFQGLNMTQIGSFGLGLMYFFEIPTFFVGLFLCFKKKSTQDKGSFSLCKLIFIWIILGLIPAAITQDDLNPIRTLLIVPMTVLLSATGLVFIWEQVKKIKIAKIRSSIYLVSGFFITWNLIYAFLIFSINFPIEKSEDFLYGSKQSALFALNQETNFKEIVFDPMRGTLSPEIRSVPHLYLLFYAKFDPVTYQAMPKKGEKDIYQFSKFTFRQVNWRVDQNKKGVLFIGSPWDFPQDAVSKEQIKQKFYLLDGQLALMAVSP